MTEQVNKSFGEALKEKLIQLRLPQDSMYLEGIRHYYPLPINACTSEEIDKLKKLQNVENLPEVYVEFMLHMGKWCGDIFLGYDIVYHYISAHNMKEAANKLLQNDSKQALAKDDFVFMNLQGHSYWFFPTTEGEDPPVYMYIMDDGADDPDYPTKDGPIKIFEYLSEFLSDFIRKRESENAQNEFLRQYAVELRK
jgi:hypothetical protein